MCIVCLNVVWLLFVCLCLMVVLCCWCGVDDFVVLFGLLCVVLLCWLCCDLWLFV